MSTDHNASVLFFTNKTLPAPTTLTSITEIVYGVWNTSTGKDSRPSSAGTSPGTYVNSEGPTNAFDGSIFTEYAAYGTCDSSTGSSGVQCGKNTGLYLSPLRGISFLAAFTICPALYYTNCDPITVTIEGSNAPLLALTLGSSWTLIYNRSAGLDVSPGVLQCGVTQWLPSHSIWYLSYRILITSKRSTGNYVQYSELQLSGY